MNSEGNEPDAIEMKDLECKEEASPEAEDEDLMGSDKSDNDLEPAEANEEEDDADDDEVSDDMDEKINAMENQDTDDEGEIDPTPTAQHRGRQRANQASADFEPNDQQDDSTDEVEDEYSAGEPSDEETKAE